MKKEAPDLAVELRGISATLIILSNAFSAEETWSPEIISSSLYGIGLQVDRLADEVAGLEFMEAKQELNRLRELRTVRCIDLSTLEKLSGIPRETLEKIEDGEQVILDTRSIAKLAEALDAKPSEIFVA